MKIQHFGLFLVFLLVGFTAAGLLLQQKDALPDGAFGQKLAHFRDHGKEYDVVFIGNSRTYRQVDAPAIETVCPKYKVFNFGIQNLMLEEMDFIAEWVRTHGKEDVKIIISEPSPAMRDFKQMQTERLVYFSSLSHLPRRFENIWSYNEPTHKKAYRSAVALYGTLYAGTHIGSLGKKLFPEAYAKKAEEDKDNIGMPEDAAENGGYFSLDAHAQTNEWINGRHEDFVANPRQAKASAGFAMDIYESYFTAKNSGFFMPPMPAQAEADKALQTAIKEKYPDVKVFNMNDAASFPQLFETDRWFDEGHLNETGAWEMSEMMAQELCTDVVH